MNLPLYLFLDMHWLECKGISSDQRRYHQPVNDAKIVGRSTAVEED